LNYIKQLNAFWDSLEQNHVTASAQLLYHTLLMVNNRCGWSEWFARTNQSLCGIMGISENTLLRSRNELKTKNYIEFKTASKKGEITKYRLLEIMGSKYGAQNEPEPEPIPAPIAEPKPEPQTDDINKRKPKLKLITNKISDYTDNQILQERIKDFQEMRKAIKKPMTDRALELILKKLDTFAQTDDEKIAILEASIANSWLGVFPLKEDKKSGISEDKMRKYAEIMGEGKDWNYGW
jgi:hypothetical protein